MKTDIKATILPAAAAITLTTIVIVGHAAGQQSPDRGVQQATFSRPASGDAVQKARFSRQAVHKGDEVEQNIALEMRLTMTMRQANQVVGNNRTVVRTHQRRIITTTNVERDLATAVAVRYPVATKQMSAIDGGKGDAADTNSTPAQSTPIQQPVQGKAYVCHREPGDQGQLLVTDEAGNRPPTDEYEIVAQQMQMVGRPNPLAQFLTDRTISVGEKVELPNGIASQIFNLGERFGKVTRFTLTLQKVQSEGGATCAVFLASVEAASNNSTQMRLDVEGPLVVDIATCRAQRIDLIGPIGMSETRGSYSTAYQMIGTGRLQMSIASTYRDAKR